LVAWNEKSLIRVLTSRSTIFVWLLTHHNIMLAWSFLVVGDLNKCCMPSETVSDENSPTSLALLVLEKDV